MLVAIKRFEVVNSNATLTELTRGFVMFASVFK